MGKLEQSVKIRTRNTKITRAILLTLLLATAAALNPQALVRGVLKELKSPKSKRRDSQNAIYVARARLAKQGLIEYREGFWEATIKGRRAFQVMTLSEQIRKKPRRWDKKWRLLIFDITESKRGLRAKVRNTLSTMGFRKLQNSVCAYPYDCEDLIALLKADFEIGKELLYIIADEVENDHWLKREFQLS